MFQSGLVPLGQSGGDQVISQWWELREPYFAVFALFARGWVSLDGIPCMSMGVQHGYCSYELGPWKKNHAMITFGGNDLHTIEPSRPCPLIFDEQVLLGLVILFLTLQPVSETL